MGKITEGEWTIRQTHTAIEIRVEGQYMTVAEMPLSKVGYRKSDLDDALADATLMASAKKLLDACKKAYKCLTLLDDLADQQHPESPYHFLGKAIAEAQGLDYSIPPEEPDLS